MADYFLTKRLARPGHPEPRKIPEASLPTMAPPSDGLTDYLSLHHDELIALVEARRRPEYADHWEEI